MTTRGGGPLRMRVSHCLVLAGLLSTTGGCDGWTDAATRLASDIEAGSGRLGGQSGAKHSITHTTPSKAGECTGPYVVQVDKVGAIVIWCKDEAGRTVSSHSTTYHSRFIDTPRTYILEKPAGATLTIDIERRNGRAVVTDVR